MREIIIRTIRETAVPAEALYELRKASFAQWKEAGLDITAAYMPIQKFVRIISHKTVMVFVAHDATTGELLAMHILRLKKKKCIALGDSLAVAPTAKHEGIASQMLQEEVKRLSMVGYRYLCGATAITATWSVRWHLKNGYYITGYHRNEDKNYDSYTFRKPIALDVRHHPLDLLWTRPIAPVTAHLHYLVSYLITILLKTRTGHLKPLGHLAKRILRRMKKQRKLC